MADSQHVRSPELQYNGVLIAQDLIFPQSLPEGGGFGIYSNRRSEATILPLGPMPSEAMAARAAGPNCQTQPTSESTMGRIQYKIVFGKNY